jgi:hypothetical protein
MQAEQKIVSNVLVARQQQVACNGRTGNAGL